MAATSIGDGRCSARPPPTVDERAQPWPARPVLTRAVAPRRAAPVDAGTVRPSPPVTVEAVLPSWLGGRDPAAFAATARWHARHLHRHRWSIALEERHLGQTPGLVRARRLADANNVDSAGALAALRLLPPHAVHLSEEARRLTLDYLSNAPATMNHVEAVSRLVTATMSCPDARIEETVRQGLRMLLDMEVLGGHASVELVEHDQALAVRMGAARTLAQCEQPDAAVALGHAARSGAVPAVSPLAAGRGLASGLTFGLDAYLAPLLLSVSPYVWAVACPRAGGVILYTFGTAIRGREGQHSELLQTMMPKLGGARPTARPPLRPAELRAATGWYVDRLDVLLSTASDPARHTDGTGRYDPTSHLETLISVEQLFRTVQSVGAADRDEFASRVMGLSALDTFEGLGLPKADELYLLPKARRVLDDLERTMPADAAAVLLPRARGAVSGLAGLQEGFLLTRRGDDVLLPDERGVATATPVAAAAARYLRLVRNADHHTFGGKGKHRNRDVALLLGHDGNVPTTVADLSWLYLLGLLSDASQLTAR